ncbi:MAG: hypothetical protein GY729_06215, partial [Desulfobacteraceae bacterium]|nr:hypothetical protein [Desulfobacteraceae bacterium]
MMIANKYFTSLLLCLFLFFCTSQTLAGEWSDDQKNVWQMEKTYWESIQSGHI